LLSGLREAFEGAGVSWSETLLDADELVLFGSRAAGVARSDSDWDVLCVGTGTRLRSGLLDLLWVPPRDIESQGWLGSELAAHVAIYGVWFKGQGDWRIRVGISIDSIERKRRRIRRRLTGLKRVWRMLIPEIREARLDDLRRDLQRLELLEKESGPPPTPILDRRWRSSANALPALQSIAKWARATSERSEFVRSEVIPTLQDLLDLETTTDNELA
jgi:hypothetical protein